MGKRGHRLWRRSDVAVLGVAGVWVGAMGAISALLFAEQLSQSDAAGLRCSCGVGLNPQVEVTVFLF